MGVHNHSSAGSGDFFESPWESGAGRRPGPFRCPPGFHPPDSRSRCTLARDCSLLIHLESPLRVAIFPSRLRAAFRVTKGKPVVTHFKYTSFKARHSLSRSPPDTSIPRDRRYGPPPPSTRGLGSSIPKTTFLTPHLQDGFGAGRGSTGMVAGFQGHVQGGPSGFSAGLRQGDPFGMGPARFLVISRPNHPAAPDHYRPHQGIRRSPTRSLAGQTQGLPQIGAGLFGFSGHWLSGFLPLPAFFPRFLLSRSSFNSCMKSLVS